MKISVHLKPNSRHREEVVMNDDGSLTVYTKAPAIEGRANLATVKLLAKYFGVSDRYFLDMQNDIDIRNLKISLAEEINKIRVCQAV